MSGHRHDISSGPLVRKSEEVLPMSPDEWVFPLFRRHKIAPFHENMPAVVCSLIEYNCNRCNVELGFSGNSLGRGKGH